MQQVLTWEEKNYSIVITADGSPSLHWKKDADAVGELMHHRGGALAETEQIYASVVSAGIEAGMRSFLSVGLGLGYNELVIARELHRAKLPLSEIKLLSFEADVFLAENFIHCVNNPQSEWPIHQIYKQILQLVAADEAMSVLAILRELYRTGAWQLNSALSGAGLDELGSFRYEVILFDAFSTKTTPELWSEEFLQKFLAKITAANCLFSTYACTGVLKRALASNHFEVQLRDGFLGKRNSTLGRRRSS